MAGTLTQLCIARIARCSFETRRLIYRLHVTHIHVTLYEIAVFHTRIFQSCIFHPCILDAAFSNAAFSFRAFWASPSTDGQDDTELCWPSPEDKRLMSLPSVRFACWQYKALSTLSQKSETVAENGDCRRFPRQSHFSATVWTGLKTDVFD